MKILLISHEMSYTGAPNSLKNICRVLLSHGHDVAVWTLATGPFAVEFQKLLLDVNTVSLEDDATHICSNIHTYDLVIANTIFCTDIAHLVQQFVPTILFIREAHNIPDIIRDCHLNEQHFLDIKYTVCVSEYAQEFIFDHYGFKPQVIHNYVEDCYHKHWKLPIRRRTHFMVAGTIEQRKGYHLAVQAIQMLPRALQNKAVLHLVGRVPDWSMDYWSSIVPYLCENIIYHGEITDPKAKFDLFTQMDVFVIPSYDESCSLVALEGAMLAKPLIVTENVGAKYLVTKKNGLVVQTGNATALASAFEVMIWKSSFALQAAGNSSRKSYVKHASSEAFKSNFMKITEETV